MLLESSGGTMVHASNAENDPDKKIDKRSRRTQKKQNERLDDDNP
jgi:hypothetical protein